MSLFKCRLKKVNLNLIFEILKMDSVKAKAYFSNEKYNVSIKTCTKQIEKKEIIQKSCLIVFLKIISVYL